MKRLVMFVFLAIAVISALADSQIKGTIVNTDNEPVESAEVVALDRDSVMVDNTWTDENGRFVLYAKDVAVVAVKAMGYEFVSRDAGLLVNFSDTVRLADAPVGLKNIEVSAPRPKTVLSEGGLLTNVAGTYLSQLGTANDVLRWIPMVMGDDGNFKVFGRGAAVIYINGRIMRDKTDLEQLSSNNIRDIKVISNPGAAYNASVKAVIIIRTLRPHGEGFSLDLRSRTAMAHYTGTLGRADINYRTGGLDIALQSYANYDKIKTGTDFLQETHLNSNSVLADKLDQTVTNRTLQYIEKFIVNYEINKNHSLGGFYRFTSNDNQIRFSNTGDVSKDSEPLDYVTGEGDTRTRNHAGHSTNMYYSGAVGYFRINFNMDYYYSSPTVNSLSTELSRVYDSRTVLSQSKNRSRLFAHKAVVQYYKHTGYILIGEEYTASRLDMNYRNIEDILPGGASKIKETNQSLYTEAHKEFGENIQFTLGVRYQHIGYDYRKDDTDNDERTYNNVFPFFRTMVKFGDLSMSLSYRNRLSRPSYSQLDGTMRYDNRYQYQCGNPLLRSSRNESLELMATCAPLYLQVSYTRQRNPVIFYAEPYDMDNDVNLITYINGPTLGNLSAIAGMTVGNDGVWNLQLSGGVSKQRFKMMYDSQMMSFGKPLGMVQAQGTFNLPFGVRFFCDYTFQTRGNMQNVYMRSHSILNMALYKTFFNKKFDIRISGLDMFKGNTDRITMYSGNVMINTTETFDSRKCILTLRYHLNVPKDRYRGTGAGHSEKERM